MRAIGDVPQGLPSPPAADAAAPAPADAECPHMSAVAAGLRRLARPTHAELAARLQAAYAPLAARTRRPMNEAERARLGELRAHFTNPDAAAQWGGLSARVRKLLVLEAGLRDSSPGEALASIAGRDWDEFPASEQRAIGQAVRLLLRTLVRLTAISGTR